MSASDTNALARVVVDHGFRLHKELGPGLLESAYELLLAASLERAGLTVERQKPIAIRFDGIVIPDAFRVDLIVADRLIVELKSVERIQAVHAKQLLTYLRMTQITLGLLINFGAETYREGVKRVVNGHPDA